MTDWSGWIGRTREIDDDIVKAPARRMKATLGNLTVEPAEPGEALPPLWHWVNFLEAASRDEIGPDGHAAKGGFLPPIPLPRRMYAGGRLTFPDRLVYGRPAKRVTRIVSVEEKQGRSGPLAFVTVRHEIFQDGRLATTEEHDIVYRAEGSAPGRPAPSEARAVSEETVEPDEVMLFRFSALTFNGHRIHYDQPYVTQVEDYPGLIVHGPLIAMLLFEAARRAAPERRPTSFSFRAMSPVFCGNPLRLVRTESPDDAPTYEARHADDTLAMKAEVGFG